MKLSRTMALLVALLQSVIGCRQAPDTKGTRAESPSREITAPIFECPQVDGFERSDLRTFEDPQWGYSFAYQSEAGATATVYVYDLGLPSIPDGIFSREVRGEMARAKEEITDAKRQGMLKSVNFRDESEVRLGSTRGAPQVLHLVLDLELASGPAVSDLYLTGYHDHFVKIRSTYSVASRRQCEQDMRKLLAALAEGFKR